MFLEKKSEVMIEMTYPLMDTEFYRRRILAGWRPWKPFLKTQRAVSFPTTSGRDPLSTVILGILIGHKTVQCVTRWINIGSKATDNRQTSQKEKELDTEHRPLMPILSDTIKTAHIFLACCNQLNLSQKMIKLRFWFHSNLGKWNEKVHLRYTCG
jgi:hypothetical protein